MTYKQWIRRERSRKLRESLIVYGAAFLAGAAMFAFLSLGLALDALIVP